MKTEYDRILAEAKKRVYADPDLYPHKDILLDYEWDNMRDHLEWVATENKADLMRWIRVVRADSGHE